MAQMLDHFHIKLTKEEALEIAKHLRTQIIEGEFPPELDPLFEAWMAHNFPDAPRQDITRYGLLMRSTAWPMWLSIAVFGALDI